jgi:hypothetical protein
MLITAAAILAAPIRFSFNRWDPPDKITEIITIDATVIVGTLFFLNLQNLESQALPLIRDLTALTIIPFAFSAILVTVWGRHPFWEESEKTTKDLNPNKVTGIKLGITFMLAGFVWLIVTMIILLLISTPPPVQHTGTKNV